MKEDKILASELSTRKYNYRYQNSNILTYDKALNNTISLLRQWLNNNIRNISSVPFVQVSFL